MKLIMENWRRYLKEMAVQEMAFQSTTRRVVGFDFDHTIAKTSGGQVAFFDPKGNRVNRAGEAVGKESTAISPEFVKAQGGSKKQGEVAAQPITDAQILKIKAMPAGPKQLATIEAALHCKGDIKQFWCGSQVGLDFYSQAKDWQAIWQAQGKEAPNCWGFDYSARDELHYEGDPNDPNYEKDAAHAPVIAAYKDAMDDPGTEVMILTSRKEVVVPQIIAYCKKIGITPPAKEHIWGCAGCDKGKYLRDQVLKPNDDTPNITTLEFYDDSGTNVHDISKAMKEAVASGLIEKVGIIYKVDAHSGNFKKAGVFKGKGAAEEPEEPEAAPAQEEPEPETTATPEEEVPV